MFNDFVKSSCTVVIGKSVFFFGGWWQDSQISQLTPLGLVRIGTLPFTLVAGNCIVIDNEIFLGSGFYNQKTCWSRSAVLNSGLNINLILAQIWPFSKKAKHYTSTGQGSLSDTMTRFWRLEDLRRRRWRSLMEEPNYPGEKI